MDLFSKKVNGYLIKPGLTGTEGGGEQWPAKSTSLVSWWPS
jgi:hypothetical protein